MTVLHEARSTDPHVPEERVRARRNARGRDVMGVCVEYISAVAVTPGARAT